MKSIPAKYHILLLAPVSMLGVAYSLEGINYIFLSWDAIQEIQVNPKMFNSPNWMMLLFQILAVVLLASELLFSIALFSRRRFLLIGFCLVLVLQQMCVFVSSCLWALPRFGRAVAEVTVSAFAPFAIQLNTGFPIWSLIAVIWMLVKTEE